MSEKRVVAHLLRVGMYGSMVFWLAFVWGAVKVLSWPDTGRHSHLAGWTILIVAAVIMLATMDHWVKYFQVILGAAILGGLLVTGTGHLLNDARPFPRLAAAGMTALFVGCSAIASTIARRKLKVLDRVALIAFLVSLVGGMAKNAPKSNLVGLSIGFACLLGAWISDRCSVPNSEPR
jgi:hypothetical protein